MWARAVRPSGLRRPGLPRAVALGVGFGALVGAGYAAYTHYEINRLRAIAGTGRERVEPRAIAKPAGIAPTRRIVGALDPELDITLFQYQTCPFCSKVRAFLDYNGFSYDVVEVDAVLRQTIKWSEYKKVPIALVKTEEGYRQMNDSSVIVSTLASSMINEFRNVDDVVEFYPALEIVGEHGKKSREVLNKYFLMYQNEPRRRSDEALNDERYWRRWADETLVHTISPNVYRTLDEAYRTFEWFATIGEWHDNFPSWEVKLMVNVGAVAMWAIAKRLKKKHNLKDDVRTSLYDECNYWAKNVRLRGADFMGGTVPDLSDLAVYGVLCSMEGCEAFKDLLDNSKIKDWFYRMKDLISQNKGKVVPIQG